MAFSFPQWNPFEVLEIGNISSGFTCFGYAPSQGRRCHNPIAIANRQGATTLLIQMSELGASSPSVKCMLQLLAPRILCKRYHQNQAPCIVAQWLGSIQRFQQILEVTKQVRAYSRPAPAANFILLQMAEPRRMITVEASSQVISTRASLSRDSPTPRGNRGLILPKPRQEEPAENQQNRPSRRRVVVSHQTDSNIVSPSPRQERQVGVQRNEPIITNSRQEELAEDQLNRSSRRRVVVSHQIDSGIVSPSPRQDGQVEQQRNESRQRRPYSSHVRGSSSSSPSPRHQPLLGEEQNEPIITNSRQEEVAEDQQNRSSRTRVVVSHQTDSNIVSPSPRQELQVEELRNESSRDTGSRQGLLQEEEPRNESSQNTPGHQIEPCLRQGSLKEEEQDEPGRKMVTGECPICYENLKNDDGVLWCKAQCGQNFHRECIGYWLGMTQSEKLCPYCRVEWVN